MQAESGGPSLHAVYGTSHQRRPREPGEEACPNNDRLNFKGESRKLRANAIQLREIQEV